MRRKTEKNKKAKKSKQKQKEKNGKISSNPIYANPIKNLPRKIPPRLDFFCRSLFLTNGTTFARMMYDMQENIHIGVVYPFSGIDSGEVFFPNIILAHLDWGCPTRVAPSHFTLCFGQGKSKARVFSGSDLLTCMLPTFCPLTIWAGVLASKICRECRIGFSHLKRHSVAHFVLSATSFLSFLREIFKIHQI